MYEHYIHIRQSHTTLNCRSVQQTEDCTHEALTETTSGAYTTAQLSKVTTGVPSITPAVGFSDSLVVCDLRSVVGP